MAKLPDGWVLIPKLGKRITINIEQHELVMCRNCKHRDPEDFKCDHHDGYIVCDKDGFCHSPDWFCADGKRKEADPDA